jgi:endo-1,4-beta-xylanase
MPSKISVTFCKKLDNTRFFWYIMTTLLEEFIVQITKFSVNGTLFGIIIFAVILGFTAAGCDIINTEPKKTEQEQPNPPIPTVSTVTVSPATSSVAKGGTQQFTATVNGTNSPAQTVTWSIVQPDKNGSTTITTSGLLTVASAETLTTLTVRAASTADTGKSGTATVTVTGGASDVPEFTGFNGETFNSLSAEQVTRKENGYDYELWNQDRSGTATMTLGNGGGGTFKCEWNNIKNVLFRAGRKFNETQTHSQIGSISIEYTANKFNITKGNNAYLSVYGWITGGTGSATTKDNLVEYYIVENYGDYNPGTGGTEKGTVTIDGAQYKLYVKTINGPSIKNGINTFTQYLSVRQTKRLSGTIDVTAHFNAWNTANMTLVNGKMYEVAFKVESYGGTSFNAGGNAEITKNILRINGVPIQ